MKRAYLTKILLVYFTLRITFGHNVYPPERVVFAR